MAFTRMVGVLATLLRCTWSPLLSIETASRGDMKLILLDIELRRLLRILPCVFAFLPAKIQ